MRYLPKDDQERGTISSPENEQLYMKNVIHIFMNICQITVTSLRKWYILNEF